MRRRSLAKSVPGGIALLLLVAAASALSLMQPAPARAHDLCGATGSPFGPFDLQAYEHGDYKNAYARTMDLAGFNELFPELPSFALPALETGGRDAASAQTAPPYIPPVVLKAIGWIESGWAQADYSVPYGGIGGVLASHDCGYGIMQITSGMQNVSGVPSLDQAMIGGHYAFNIARGAKILADKWNMAPEWRPIVGNREASLIENWYYALWGYNGFAFKNHPLNADYQGARPPFSCAPDGDGFGHDRSQYPYQELILGCAGRPPLRSGTPLWPVQELHLPDLSDAAFAQPLKLENWSPCSHDLQCAPMDIPTPNTNHTDPAVASATRSQVLGAPALAVSASELSLVAVGSALRGSAAVTVSNTGTGLLAYRATTTASWLKVSRFEGVALGSDLGPQPADLVVRVESAGLPPGDYTARVNLESLYSAGSPAAINVTLRNYPDGTLLMGSGPVIYAVRGNLLRAVPGMPTFEAQGFRLASVLSIPDETLAALPQGRPLPDVGADGNVVKAQGPGLYVMQAGARRHIAGPAVMAACAYAWDAVAVLSDAALEAIPAGEPLTGSPCPLLMPPAGAIIRASGPEVFVMQGGLRRHIPDVLTFQGSGLGWGDIDLIADSQLAAIPVGQPLLELGVDGSLLKGAGPKVYVMSGGTKRHIADEAAFRACGYGWDAVRDVPGGALNGVPAGPQLTGAPCPAFSPPDGVLLQAEGPAIYVMQGGTKRHIATFPVFSGCRYLLGNVNAVARSTLEGIPEGAPLTGTPCP